MIQHFIHKEAFELEQGYVLPQLEITYASYGTLNASGSNVVWICHALTANAEAGEWWPGMVGKGFAIDPEKDFIICANIIGSCYGSSGP
ncbi:MAG: homoserine O-acetyltransferase, partial [Chitinophagaceae bacterium]